MCLIVPTWKRKGDVNDPGKYSGITLLSQVLKLLERVLDARIRRIVEGEFGGRPARFQEGERNSRRDVRPETDGREETGGTGQYGSGVRRPRELLTQYPERWSWRRYGGWAYQKRKWGWLRARTRRQQHEWWWEKALRTSLRSILD